MSLNIGDHYENYRVADVYIKRWVAKCFFERSGDAVSSHTLNDVLKHSVLSNCA